MHLTEVGIWQCTASKASGPMGQSLRIKILKLKIRL
jgi:hypothetical protein